MWHGLVACVTAGDDICTSPWAVASSKEQREQLLRNDSLIPAAWVRDPAARIVPFGCDPFKLDFMIHLHEWCKEVRRCTGESNRTSICTVSARGTIVIASTGNIATQIPCQPDKHITPPTFEAFTFPTERSPFRS
jgi:hypothetical protein